LFRNFFVRRGLMAFGFGPIVLAAVYLILSMTGAVETLEITDVSIGILSLSVLAFAAGGLNALYQLERLPLAVAVFIHGAVLYVLYMGTYLVNSWLEWGMIPILVFTGIFVVGYLIIWAIIFAVISGRTKRINEILKIKQEKR